MSEKMEKRNNPIINLGKKFLVTTGLVLVLGGAAKEANAATPVNNSETTSSSIPSNSEATNAALFKDFSEGNFETNGAVSDSIEDPRSIEFIAKKYVKDNVYIGGKKLGELGAKVEKKSGDDDSVECTAELEYNLKNGEKSDGTIKILLDFTVNFPEHGISIECNNTEFSVGNYIYNKDYIKADNGNIYDVVKTDNGKTINYLIAYNNYRTNLFISKNVQKPNLKNKNIFPESVPELKDLNDNIILGKEVNINNNTYTRDLFFGIGGNYIKILSVPFDKDGNPSSADGTIEVFGKKVTISVDENLNVHMSEADQNILLKKLEDDKNALTELFNKMEDVSHPKFFECLDFVNKDGRRGFDSDYISIENPLKGIYSVQINKTNKNNKIYFKIDGNGKFSLADINGNVVSEYYFNFEKDNYYKVVLEGKVLKILKMDEPGENPKTILPTFSGDNNAINLLKQGIYVAYDVTNLKYYDKEGNLICAIPCEKDPDGTYILKNDYTTQLDVLNLFNYNGYENSINSKVYQLAKELGIADIHILNIFKQQLEDKKIDFNRNCIEIRNPQDGFGIYYKLTQRSDKIVFDRDNRLYQKCVPTFDVILERLNNLKKIENMRIVRKNGKTYEDFTTFNGGQNGIGWETIPSEDKTTYTNGNGIRRGIMWGTGQAVDIEFDGDGNPKIVGDNTIIMGSQEYKVSIIKINGVRVVALDPVEL